MSVDEEQSSWPGLEVAIEGTNLSPADVPVRQVVELLEAAAAALETIAAERGIDLTPPRLLAVKTGSAAYELRFPDPTAAPVVEELAHHIETRGKQSSPAVRHSIDRLHRAGRIGSVRLQVFDAKGKPRAKPLHIAKPLELVHAPFDAVSEVFGRVIGVSAGRGDRLTVRLRLDDGGGVEFASDQEVARLAGRLFLRLVRAEVAYELTPEGESPGEITRIEAFEPVPDDEILDGFEQARKQLADHGVKLRASDWLKDLDE